MRTTCRDIASAAGLSLTVLIVAMQGTCLAQESPRRFDPLEKTIPEIRAAIDSGAITCTELVQWYLDRIEAYDRSGPRLNAVRNQRASLAYSSGL